MSTATPAASAGSSFIREGTFRSAHALHPGKDAQEIAQKAAFAENVINFQLTSSPTWEAYFKLSAEMRQARLAQMSPDDRQKAETICAEIKGREAAFKRREMFFIDHPDLAPSGSMEDRAQVWIQEATAAGLQVHSQNCKTCSRRNFTSITEGGELKHLLQRCKACKTAIYCSIDCQKKAWLGGHNVECLNIQGGTR